VADQPDPARVELDARPGTVRTGTARPGTVRIVAVRPASQQVVEEEAQVRHPAGDYRLDPRGASRVGLLLRTGQLGDEHLGVVQRGDGVPVAGQVGAQERS
jgi:hypothetical protein